MLVLGIDVIRRLLFKLDFNFGSKGLCGLEKKEGGFKVSAIQKSIRLISIAFGVIALFMALSFPKIADLMVIGLGTIVIFVLVTIFALIRKNVLKYRIAALISIITGFLVNLFSLYGE